MFSIASWGNSGQQWILDCLNLHSRIRVVSSARRAEESASEFVARIAVGNDGVFRGDIGSIGSHEFASLRDTFGEHCALALLVGHPIQRYAGSIAFSKEIGRHWTRDHLRELWAPEPFDSLFGSITDILRPDDDHVPAHYALHCARTPSDVVRSGAFPVHLNALMSNDAAWDAFVRHITSGALSDFDGRWRQLERQCPNVAHAPFLQTPEAVWNGLTEPQQLVFANMLDDAVREQYVALGYDLSFVLHQQSSRIRKIFHRLLRPISRISIKVPTGSVNRAGNFFRRAYATDRSDFDAAAFEQDGFQTVRNVFTKNERIDLNRKWREHYGQTLAHGRALAGNPVEVKEVPQFLRTLVINPKCLGIAQSLLGPNVALYDVRLLLKDKAWNGPAWYHHDAPYYSGAPGKVSLFIALDHADVDNGSLFFVRGSHRFGLMVGDYHKNQSGTIDGAFLAPTTGLQHECPTLETGDVVVANMFTWHYSPAAKNDKVRALVQVLYTPSSDAYAHKLLSGVWDSTHCITTQDGRRQIVPRPRRDHKLWRP